MMTLASIFLKLSHFRQKYLDANFYQFHFQFVFGYQLKTARCSSKIANESIAIHGEE